MLKIKNWAERFENNRTREVRVMSWMPFPTNPGGETQVMLLNHKEGIAHLACWLVLCQVAATSPARGCIARENGSAHTPETLELVSRIPAKHFKDAIDRLLTPQFGVLSQEGATPPQEAAACPQEPATSPQEGAPDVAEGCATDIQTGQDMTGHNITHCRSACADGKVIEHQPPTPKKTKPPKAPQPPDEIWDACIELFYGGTTRVEVIRPRLNKFVADLKALGATAPEMRRRLANLKRSYPDTVPTEAALIRHWDGNACRDKPPPEQAPTIDWEAKAKRMAAMKPPEIPS